MNRPSVRRGFTLIELLMVIAIIGILSAIVLGALNNARSKGNDAAVKSNLAGARSLAEVFYDVNGNQYVTVGGAGTANDVCSASALVNGAKGVYDQVKAAADVAGVSLTTTLTTVSSPTMAACHACPISGACNPKNAWAAEVPLKSGNYFCVDSSGYSGVQVLNLANGDTLCN